MDTPTIIVLAGLFLFFFLFPIVRRIRWKSSGKLGEMIVAKRLSRLPKEKYRVINDLLLQSNGYSSQIDHIVVSIYGIFVIETKNYTGDIYGGPNSEMWTQNIYGSKSQLRNPVWQNQGHITAIRKVLGKDWKVPYFNIVLFSNNARLKVNNCPVYNWRRIDYVIGGYVDEVITTETVDKIYSALIKANVEGKRARKDHVKKVKETKQRRDVYVANGKCPKCGGNLVLRNGKYGSFYGCSNYPKCNYILNK